MRSSALINALKSGYARSWGGVRVPCFVWLLIGLSGCGGNGVLDASYAGNAEFTPTVSDAAALKKSLETPGLSSQAYRIGPQDLLELTVFNVPSMSRPVQVSGDGTISVQLLGEVRAAGKTAQELERELKSRLGARYLRDPQVSIVIKEYNSQRLTIEGAVRRPGVFPIKNSATLMQSISAAEGLDKDTASSDVIVFRTENGQRLAARFDLDAIRNGSAADPQIKSGDVIIVGASAGKMAFQNLTKLLPVTALFRPF